MQLFIFNKTVYLNLQPFGVHIEGLPIGAGDFALLCLEQRY